MLKKIDYDWRLIVAFLALVTTLLAIFINVSLFNARDENEKSQLELQLIISPLPREQLDKAPSKYRSEFLITNSGKATAKSINLVFYTNTKHLTSFKQPFLIGSDHGSDIKVIPLSTNGMYEIKVKDLPPGVGFLLGFDHSVKDQFTGSVYSSWKKSMLSTDFTSYFILDVNANGEKTSLKNVGAYKILNNL